MLAGLEAQPQTFIRILESMQVDVIRFNKEQFEQVYFKKANFIFSRALTTWKRENLHAMLAQLKPETFLVLASEWLLGSVYPGLNRMYFSKLVQDPEQLKTLKSGQNPMRDQVLEIIRGVLEEWQQDRPEAYAAFWKAAQNLDTAHQVEIFQSLNSASKGAVPIYAKNWVKSMLEAAGINPEGALRLALWRMAGNTFIILGLGILLGHLAIPGVAIVLTSVWGAIGGLGLLINYLPKFYYVRKLANHTGEVLTDATIQPRLENLLLDLERRGELPADYQRPRLRVLLPQSRLSGWLTGWLIGRGHHGVVALHRNFLALPYTAQMAVLRHEIYEAMGHGHFQAMKAEVRSLWTLGRKGPEPGRQSLAYQLRSIPLANWLGPELDKTLREKVTALGFNPATYPLIDVTDGHQVIQASEKWMKQGMDPKSYVAARVVYAEPFTGKVSFTLVIDTLENMRNNFSMMTDMIKGDAMLTAPVAIHLELRPPYGTNINGTVDFSALGLRADLRQQGQGGKLIGAVHQVLQGLLPGAVLTGKAIHPAAAKILAREFRVDLDWAHLQGDWLFEGYRAFKLLGMAKLEDEYPTAMQLRTALENFKAAQGASGQSEIAFLLDRLHQLALDLHADPRRLEAWVAANQNNLFSEPAWAPLAAYATKPVGVLEQALYEKIFEGLRLRGLIARPAGAAAELNQSREALPGISGETGATTG